jgi:hypothetical protein
VRNEVLVHRLLGLELVTERPATASMFHEDLLSSIRVSSSILRFELLLRRCGPHGLRQLSVDVSSQTTAQLPLCEDVPHYFLISHNDFLFVVFAERQCLGQLLLEELSVSFRLDLLRHLHVCLLTGAYLFLLSKSLGVFQDPDFISLPPRDQLVDHKLFRHLLW